ncbi:unnamed protein product [Adineta steineri]|uniref:NAD(P)(+)--arginine ADP-ribosyltransferase n=1 Tax=Adineta steineri TaxID=433720 RepID=A0A820AJU0_9BILA|nr:unnamed protein product [Adineta steineri]CAF4178758.1 unnamed protein product [Adineta steineri]
MAISKVSTSLLPNKLKIVWFWQSNADPWNEKEQREWKRYSDFENEFIEEAYQRSENEVDLIDHVIEFERNIQYNKRDRNKQRRVKRDEIDVSNYVRVERFCYPEKAVKLFDDGDKPPDCAFMIEWRRRKRELGEDGVTIAELAAQGKNILILITNLVYFVHVLDAGILREGKLLNQEFDAQRMADQLRSYTNDDRETYSCAARLYTAESFLYKLLNSTLRNEDMSKADTLGPFFHLLYRHVQVAGYDREEQIVYRGTTLTNEMLEGYKKAIGTSIRWLAFTSTSKDRRVAETFNGNTLFIITLQSWFLFDARCAVSALSHYPDEQEILLTASYRFRVEKVDHDTTSGKYFIYMRDENRR